MPNTFQFAHAKTCRLGRYVAVACWLLLALGDTATAYAGCGEYVVAVGGARFRTAHGNHGLQSLDASLPSFGHPVRVPRMPCSGGECDGRAKLPYQAPPVTLIGSPSDVDALSDSPLAAYPRRAIKYWTLASNCRAGDVTRDDIFKPPR